MPAARESESVIAYDIDVDKEDASYSRSTVGVNSLPQGQTCVGEPSSSRHVVSS